MFTRRRILSGSAAAATGALATSLAGRKAAAMVSGNRAPSAAFDLVLFDDRFGDARAFAAELRSRGVATVATQGDIAKLWFGGLRDAAAQGSRRLAGIGRHSDLFIIETLAREAGLRRLYAARHDARRRSTLTHAIEQGADDAIVEALVDSTRQWPRRLAAALAQAPLTSGKAGGPRFETQARRSADHPGLLVSWAFG